MEERVSTDTRTLSSTPSVRVSEGRSEVRSRAVGVIITDSASKLTTNCPAHRLDAAIKTARFLNSCKLAFELPTVSDTF